MFKSWMQILQQAGSDFLADKAPRLGAALAYYAVFSMAPLLIIVIGVAGMVYGRGDAQSYIVGQLDNLIGSEGGDAVRAMLESASRGDSGIVGSVLGVAMLIVGATGLFGQLQDALDTVWDVEPRSGLGVWGIIKSRFLSFAMILGVAFLLLVSLVVSAALTALGTLWGEWGASSIGQAANALISFVVITVLFAGIFRYLPDAQVAWRDVWFGAIVTSLLFNVGKFAIGLYLGSSGIASGYGAAGSLAVLLAWLYYSSQIFLFGAELTQAYARSRGVEIVPKEGAVRIDANRHSNAAHA